MYQRLFLNELEREAGYVHVEIYGQIGDEGHNVYIAHAWVEEDMDKEIEIVVKNKRARRSVFVDFEDVRSLRIRF